MQLLLFFRISQQFSSVWMRSALRQLSRSSRTEHCFMCISRDGQDSTIEKSILPSNTARISSFFNVWRGDYSVVSEKEYTAMFSGLNLEKLDKLKRGPPSCHWIEGCPVRNRETYWENIIPSFSQIFAKKTRGIQTSNDARAYKSKICKWGTMYKRIISFSRITEAMNHKDILNFQCSFVIICLDFNVVLNLPHSSTIHIVHDGSCQIFLLEPPPREVSYRSCRFFDGMVVYTPFKAQIIDHQKKTALPFVCNAIFSLFYHFFKRIMKFTM